jgi:hypothetical protein
MNEQLEREVMIAETHVEAFRLAVHWIDAGHSFNKRMEARIRAGLLTWTDELERARARLAQTKGN